MVGSVPLRNLWTQDRGQNGSGIWALNKQNKRKIFIIEAPSNIHFSIHLWWIFWVQRKNSLRTIKFMVGINHEFFGGHIIWCILPRLLLPTRAVQQKDTSTEFYGFWCGIFMNKPEGKTQGNQLADDWTHPIHLFSFPKHLRQCVRHREFFTLVEWLKILLN